MLKCGIDARKHSCLYFLFVWWDSSLVTVPFSPRESHLWRCAGESRDAARVVGVFCFSFSAFFSRSSEPLTRFLPARKRDGPRSSHVRKPVVRSIRIRDRAIFDNGLFTVCTRKFVRRACLHPGLPNTYLSFSRSTFGVIQSVRLDYRRCIFWEENNLFLRYRNSAV